MAVAPEYLEFGQFLTEARSAAGFENQADLAIAIDCAQQSVSRWEAGRSRPRASQISKLAAVLKVEVSRLMEKAGHITSAPAVASFVHPFPVDRLDPVTFELFVEHLLQARYGREASVRRAGAQGHTQGGLDLVVDFADGRRFSFQCKRVQQFGPAEVLKAVKAHTADANQKHLVLSRIASPQAADALRAFPDWRLWDKDDLSRIIRSELSVEHQNRLVDIFFRGQRLALLGRSEPGPWMTVGEYFAPFKARSTVFSHDWDLQGRQTELAEFKQSLEVSGAPLVLLVGPGGIGKSRLLREGLDAFAAAHPAAIVRMLSPSADASPASLEDLGAGEKIIVVDDAHDRDGLASLMRFAATPENHTRLVLATRPYAEGRIIREAATLAIETPPVVRLDRLTIEDATALAKEVLSQFGAEPDLAESIVNATRDCPLVTVMAARIIAQDGRTFERAKSEPALRNFILGKFASVVVGDLGLPADQERIRDILNVLALIQPFHIEDPALLQLVQSLRGIDAIEAARLFRSLVEGGVVYRRGHQYRLMPDLLGDYLIEQSCLTVSGQLSPFALTAFENVQAPHLKNLLVNLGKLDWRLRDGNPADSKLLDVMWRSFDDIETNYDPRLDAIQSVAVFQPKQALAFVAKHARRGREADRLAVILRNIAYNYEYLDEVCGILWELGRDDKRETNPYPGHPIRVLSDLCGFEERKPVSYNKKVFDFGMSLMAQADAWNYHFSPLDIVKPVLAGEGMTTRNHGRTLSMTPFIVAYDVVSQLRQSLVDRILELLAHPQPRVARRAASVLHAALQEPRGPASAAVSSELRAQYRAEFLDTLTKLKPLLATGRVKPVTAIGIARSVSWHAQHDTGSVKKAAHAVLKAIPKTLEFRVRAGLANVSDDMLNGRPLYDGGWHERHEKWLGDLRDTLKGQFAAAELRDVVDDGLADLVAAGDDLSSSSILIHTLLRDDVELARAFVSDARTRSASLTRRFAATAIHELLRHEPKEGRAIAKQFLDSADQDLRYAAAASFGGLRRPPESEDIQLLEIALRSAEAPTVSAAIRSLWSWRELSKRQIIDLAKKANVEKAPGLANDLLMIFGDKHDTYLAELTGEDVEHFLKRLTPLEELDGHWTEEFLAYASFAYPHQFLEFVFERMDRAMAAESFQFRPLNFGPYMHIPLRLHEAVDSGAIFDRIWSWMRNHPKRGHFYFRHHVGSLFNALFAGGFNKLAAYLDARLPSAPADELREMGEVLQDAPRHFVFNELSFVIRLLERAREVGPDIVEEVTSHLYHSAAYGTRSGTLGRPTTEDVQQRDWSKDALAAISRLSPAYTLYEKLLRAAEDGIAKSIRDGEAYDDR